MGTQGAKGDIMTKASGRKAHSNGAALEKYLENIHFREAVAAGYFLHWAKQNPSYHGKQTKSGVMFMPHKASGADWIVLGSRKCQWPYIAIEAKSVVGNSLARSELSDDQALHLQKAMDGNQLGLLIVSFTIGTFAVRWSEDLFTKSGAGRSLKADSLPPRVNMISPVDGCFLHNVMGRWWAA